MKLSILAAALLLLCGCRSPGLPAQHGIRNFDKVDAILYRGAQPGTLGLEYLKSIGVKSVLNLRNDPVPGEAETCARLGMVYTNLPMSGVFAPSRAQAGVILRTAEGMPNPIFVHCQKGMDRTGLFVALWRLEEDIDWSAKDAAREQSEYGGSPFLPWFRWFIKSYRK